LYCLWFGNKKIHDLDQLKNNLDFEAAEIYLLGGGLSRWLRQCGENETAARVEKIDIHGDTTKQLSDIFSVKLPQNKNNTTALSKKIKALPAKKISVLFPSSDYKFTETENTGNNPKYGSFELKSVLASNKEVNSETGSFKLNNISSYEINESSFGFVSGSFEIKTGSFALNYFSSSFSLVSGSFRMSSFNSLFGFSSGSRSSFGFNSFAFGSFNLSEYEYEYSSSFNISSFESGSFGGNSFLNSANVNVTVPYVHYKSKNKKQENQAHITQLSPEEKIKLNIALCPLNRFGYGINLV